MSISYKVEGTAELVNWLNKTKTVMTKIQNDVMQQIIEDGVQYMKSKAPVDTGFLKANISGHVTGKSNAVITSSAYYSGFVNFGTRYMDAQPYFSDGIDYIMGRIQSIFQQQVVAAMRK